MRALKICWFLLATAAVVLMIRGFWHMTYFEYTLSARRDVPVGQREAYVACGLLLACAALAFRIHSLAAMALTCIVSLTVFLTAYTEQNGIGLLSLIALVPMVVAAFAAIMVASETSSPVE